MFFDNKLLLLLLLFVPKLSIFEILLKFSILLLLLEFPFCAFKIELFLLSKLDLEKFYKFNSNLFSVLLLFKKEIVLAFYKPLLVSDFNEDYWTKLVLIYKMLLFIFSDVFLLFVFKILVLSLLFCKASFSEFLFDYLIKFKFKLLVIIFVFELFRFKD